MNKCECQTDKFINLSLYCEFKKLWVRREVFPFSGFLRNFNAIHYVTFVLINRFSLLYSVRTILLFDSLYPTISFNYIYDRDMHVIYGFSILE